MRVGWRNRDKGLVEGEPSMLSRARQERHGSVGHDEAGDAVGDSAGASDSAEPDEKVDQPVGEWVSPASPVKRASDEPAGEQGTPQSTAVVDEGRTGKAKGGGETDSPPEQRLVEPVKDQLDRLTTQIHGLQQQLDAFISRRNEAIAERASHHVAAIVKAAEQSAADIRAAAERDAATTRERLVADAQSEVQRIRGEAEADAARIRTEAHVDAARAREKALVDASSEIQATCARLFDELRADARGEGPPPQPTQTPATGPPSPRVEKVADEVQDAVDELQRAAVVLERSLRNVRTRGDDQVPADLI